MKKLFKKAIYLSSILLVLSGCTPKSIDINTNINTKYDIPYSDIKVKDYVIEKDVKIGDVVWVNGYVPIHKGFNPQLHEVLYKKVTQGLKNAKDGGKIEISILDAGLFMEKNFADDMAFINLFRIGAEREFMCSSIVNIEDNSKFKRNIFEYKIKRKPFQNQEEISQFASDCNDKLVEQIYKYIRSEFKN